MSLINVSLINNTAYIFNAEDYIKIRKQYRIVGNLIGFNGRKPRNSNLKGLPAVFSTYELQLLLDNQAIVLLNKQKSLTDKPSIEIKNNFLSFQQHNFIEQHEYLRKQKIEESKKVLNKIIEAKQKDSIEKLQSDNIIKDIEDNVQNVPLANVLVQIPTQHSIMPLSNDHNLETLLPINEQTSFHYRVFMDLWKRGKFITNAESFGGDFLVYPNEPVCFHASHIVHVVHGVISPTFMIERARLSVMVNKFCVFAYIGPNNDIAYQTINWDGNYETAVVW